VRDHLFFFRFVIRNHSIGDQSDKAKDQNGYYYQNSFKNFFQDFHVAQDFKALIYY